MGVSVAELLQHKHCLKCGRAILASEEYCSDECKDSREALIRRKRRQLLYLYIGSAIVLFLVILFSFGGG